MKQGQEITCQGHVAKMPIAEDHVTSVADQKGPASRRGEKEFNPTAQRKRKRMQKRHLLPVCPNSVQPKGSGGERAEVLVTRALNIRGMSQTTYLTDVGTSGSGVATR